MSFNEILGQDPAIRVLKRIVESKKIAGAYLFVGPEGVGKKMTAISFARALNSDRNAINADYCDLIVLEPRGPIQRHHIDTIREMQDFVNLRSFYEGWKAVIMDDAERMTEEAAASLLKVLEEPPAKTLFILVSSCPENIFETILSRCQAIRFLPLTTDLQRSIVERHLKKNVGEEILAVSNGGVKKAMAFLNPERETWRKEILDRKFPAKDIFLFSQKIVDEKDGDDKQAFIMDTLHLLFTWWRDILFIKEGLREILNSDYGEELARQAGKVPLSSVWDNLEAIALAQRDICHQVNSRLVLDTLFLQLKTQSEKG